MRPHFFDKNSLQLLKNGDAFFPALERAINGAQDAVHLETYIFANDAAGKCIAESLARAAKRGVAVRVMVDGFGSREGFDKIRQQLLAAGVMVLIYHPQISPITLRRARLRRLHRKLVVIDGRTAFVGGINIIDDQNSSHHLPHRFDFAVRLEGPILAAVAKEVEVLWNRVAWVNFQWGWRYRHPLVCTESSGTQRAAFVIRDNLRHRSDIEDCYLKAINLARDEIVIANAYFFPGLRFRQALLRAVKRGVRVILLLQGRTDHLFFHYAAQALYGYFFDAGIEIYEYHKTFMHAKVAVIDHRWATVGSSNIDPFSLLLAREANVIVDDEPFAEELHACLLQQIREGVMKVEKNVWHRQPLWRRVMIWGAYGCARALLDLVGLGGGGR